MAKVRAYFNKEDINTSKTNWFRNQKSLLDRSFGNMDDSKVYGCGVDDGGYPWVELEDDQVAGLPDSIDHTEYNLVYLHIEMSGGDSKTPIGIVNDPTVSGLGTMTVTYSLKDGPESTDSILSIGEDMSWRIPIKTIDGAEYETIKIDLIDGQENSFNYSVESAGAKTATCQILECYFEPIEISSESYKVIIVGDTTFRIYRSI